MSMLSRIANVFRAGRLDAELDEELQFHIQERVDHLIAGGMPPRQAAEFARRQFGNRLGLRESSHDAKVLHWLDSLVQDLRFGMRMLWKDRAAITAAVISLALALGACSAAFSLIDALILRPLPVPRADQLFYLTWPDSQRNALPGVRRTHDAFSYPQYQNFRAAAGAALDLFGVSLSASFSPATFDGEEEPVRVEGVSGNAFDVLGVPPALGRAFVAADDVGPTESPVAVLSYDFWARRFARDTSVLGRNVGIGSHTFRIVGVIRRGFTGLRPGYLTDVWIPLTTVVDARTLASKDSTWVSVWGRARYGIEGEQALRIAWRNFRRDHAREALPPGTTPAQSADYADTPLEFQPGVHGADSLFRLQFRRSLLTFGVFAALLLVVAASNVANLLMSRVAGREREMALRIAIGAGRWRLARQLIVESALLAGIACAFAVILGSLAAPLLASRMGASNFPASLDLRPDWRLFGFVSLAGAVATIFFGALPAFRASVTDPGEALKTTARQSSGSRALRPLLPVQVAFSFMLLFLAGLMLTSFEKLTHVDLGFAPEHVILYTLNAKGLKPDAQNQAQMKLADRIAHAPGVEAAALSQQGLLGGAFAFVMTPFIRFPGRDVEQVRPIMSPVSPGFFGTMKIRLVEGREFEWRDPDSAAIVNEAFVRQYLGGGRALGQRFESMGDGKPVPLEVVGVAADSLFNNLREPVRPIIYTPLRNLNGATLEVRTAADPRALIASLRRQIDALHPAVKVRDSILQSTRIANTLVSERLLAALAGFFAIAAMVLIGVGLHGVVNYFVIRRTREIGIRMALGARRIAVVRLIVREVAVLIAVGVIAGAVSGRLIGRYAESLLFGVKLTDIESLAAPFAAILAACALAALRPAARATKIDPTIALRCE